MHKIGNQIQLLATEIVQCAFLFHISKLTDRGSGRQQKITWKMMFLFREQSLPSQVFVKISRH